MAQAATIPALRGWKGPVGREGLDGAVAMHTPCPGRSSHTGQSTEQVKMWSSLFGPSLQRLKGKHCHPMPCTRGLMGGAGSFGAVSPAQRSMPHSCVSGGSAKLASSSHTFQNHELTASDRSEGLSAHLTVVSVKLDTPVVKNSSAFLLLSESFPLLVLLLIKEAKTVTKSKTY